MLAIEKWAQDKPPLIALFAPQIAAFAREIPEMLKFQKKHRLLSHTFPVPDLPSWHAFYRSHRLYINPFVGDHEKCTNSEQGGCLDQMLRTHLCVESPA
jgi:hypothetical protein